MVMRLSTASANVHMAVLCYSNSYRGPCCSKSAPAARPRSSVSPNKDLYAAILYGALIFWPINAYILTRAATNNPDITPGRHHQYNIFGFL